MNKRDLRKKKRTINHILKNCESYSRLKNLDLDLGVPQKDIVRQIESKYCRAYDEAQYQQPQIQLNKSASAGAWRVSSNQPSPIQSPENVAKQKQKAEQSQDLYEPSSPIKGQRALREKYLLQKGQPKTASSSQYKLSRSYIFPKKYQEKSNFNPNRKSQLYQSALSQKKTEKLEDVGLPKDSSIKRKLDPKIASKRAATVARFIKNHLKIINSDLLNQENVFDQEVYENVMNRLDKDDRVNLQQIWKEEKDKFQEYAGYTQEQGHKQAQEKLLCSQLSRIYGKSYRMIRYQNQEEIRERQKTLNQTSQIVLNSKLAEEFLKSRSPSTDQKDWLQEGFQTPAKYQESSPQGLAQQRSLEEQQLVDEIDTIYKSEFIRSVHKFSDKASPLQLQFLVNQVKKFQFLEAFSLDQDQQPQLDEVQSQEAYKGLKKFFQKHKRSYSYLTESQAKVSHWNQSLRLLNGIPSSETSAIQKKMEKGYYLNLVDDKLEFQKSQNGHHLGKINSDTVHVGNHKVQISPEKVQPKKAFPQLKFRNLSNIKSNKIEALSVPGGLGVEENQISPKIQNFECVDLSKKGDLRRSIGAFTQKINRGVRDINLLNSQIIRQINCLEL